MLSRSLGNAAPPDLKEAYDLGPVTPPAHRLVDPDEMLAYSPNLWPAALPELRPAWTDYYLARFDLCARLMSLFALALHLPADFFADKIDRSPDILRAINYPDRQVAPLAEQLRAGAHTDYGTLTVLRQDDIGGLEVVDAQSANWSAGISCLPSCLGPGEKPKYEPVLAGPHAMSKLRKATAV